MTMEADKDKESTTAYRRLEICGIAFVVVLGLIIAIVLIVHLAEDKPKESTFKMKDAEVLSTPYAALDSGIEWLREQEVNNRWPLGHNADGVLALRLGMSKVYTLKNQELRVALRAVENDLLVALRENTLSTSFWAKGLLAKYIVALNSACLDVRNYIGINFWTILDKQYNDLLLFYNGDRRALSWYALAYCTAKEDVNQSVIANLTAHPGTYQFGIEEASMVAVALSCMDNVNMTMYGQEVMAAQDFIIARQNNDGSFGNDIETALALQAVVNANKTDIEMIKIRGLEYLSTYIQVTSGGKYRNLAAASHVMTALAGKTFADAKLGCPDQGPTTPSTGDPLNVTINITIWSSRVYIVTIRSGQSILAHCRDCRTLIDILSVSYITPKHDDSRFTFDFIPAPPSTAAPTTTTTTTIPTTTATTVIPTTTTGTTVIPTTTTGTTIPATTDMSITAMTYIIEELLDKVRRQEGWGDRQNAEAIIALRLADPQRFSLEKNTMDTGFAFGMNDMIVELALATRSMDFNNNTLWIHGKLGQYVVGLTSVCMNPQNFYGMNLLDVVEKQTQENEDFYRHQRYALSWNVLALCTANRSVHNLSMEILSDSPGSYTFEVDEAAMVSMALSCVGDSKYLTAQQAAEQYILNRTKPDGSFGNEYSTALAVQALTRYSGTDGSVNDIIRAAKDWLAGSVRGRPVNVALADQVLPALSDRSFVDVKSLPCPAPMTAVTTTPESVSVTEGAITVNVSVTDYVISSPAFSQTWEATAKTGDSMYEVLRKLETDQTSFNFTCQNTAFGQMITSIVGITVDSSQRQYWEILKFPDTSLTTGISTTYPMDGEHYIFNVTTW